jgi:hypothetical protein
MNDSVDPMHHHHLQTDLMIGKDHRSQTMGEARAAMEVALPCPGLEVSSGALETHRISLHREVTARVQLPREDSGAMKASVHPLREGTQAMDLRLVAEQATLRHHLLEPRLHLSIPGSTSSKTIMSGTKSAVDSSDRRPPPRQRIR